MEYHGICTKYNALTISIPETPNKDTIEITRHLIMTLKQKYKIDNDKILRIKDVTGELSPEIWVNDEVWNKDVIDKVNSILGYDKSVTEK